MDIETTSAIRLFFPNPSIVLVYFEAIANALDAGATEIGIDISIDSFGAPETLSIAISDNGAGFNEENFARFRTLLKPKDRFHKGVGRLVYLNYFENVEVISEWGDSRRDFVFKDGFSGASNLRRIDSPRNTGLTTLRFLKFLKDKVTSYDDLRPSSLKDRIIFHFLPSLNALRSRQVPFKITLDLKTRESNAQREFISSQVRITAEDLPEFQHLALRDDSLDAYAPIDMHYIIRKTSVAGDLMTAVSIDGRAIPVNLLSASAVPFGHSAIFLFSSSLVGVSTDTSRQKLVLPESVSESAFYGLLRRGIGSVLANEIPEIAETNQRTRKEFEDRFPHLFGFFDESVVGLIDKEDALNTAQQKFFGVQKEILQCSHLSDAAYARSLDISSRTLTEYILYREKIIEKMRSMTPHNSEEEIHGLIVPRYREFDGRQLSDEVYRNNAWLLDDRFMTFRTILSEARMEAVIDAILLEGEAPTESGRPDIAMIFSADPKDAGPVDVVVVELKKKTDDEKENQYAVNQLLDRADKLARYCPNIQRIWYYAVVDVSPSFSRSLRQQKWIPLFSKGKTYYQEFMTYREDETVVPTPIFILTFDAVVADAQARNHTFLEILKAAIRRNSRPLMKEGAPKLD